MTLKVGDKIVLDGKTYEYMYTEHDGCEGCSLLCLSRLRSEFPLGGG